MTASIQRKYLFQDKCPLLKTQNQVDTDRDGTADACDNCMFMYNPQQIDMDKDGRGDVCDPDVDGDGRRRTIDSSSR